MTESERDTWNRRYDREEPTMGSDPSAFLVGNIALIEQGTPGRCALDVACGEGRNSLFLARRGFEVTGVDNSDVGLGKARAQAEAAGLAIDYQLADLREELPSGPYDLIIIFNFLLRELIPKLYAQLAEGGFLMMEAILEAPQTHGRHRSEFVVQSGELARLFSAFAGSIVIVSEQPERERAQILFRKTQHSG